MPSPILVEPLQWNDTHVQILEMILGYISGHRNTEEEKMVKSFHKIIVLCMAILCCHGCGEDTNYWEIENPFIRFINQSDDTVWVEVLNDKEFIHHFKGTINDTLPYGMDYNRVLPHSTEQIEAYYYPYWKDVVDSLYTVRVFVSDSYSSSTFWEKNFDSDSLQLIEAAKEFDKKHLLLKKWYSKKELDSINWTIVYPQNR